MIMGIIGVIIIGTALYLSFIGMYMKDEVIVTSGAETHHSNFNNHPTINIKKMIQNSIHSIRKLFWETKEEIAEKKMKTFEQKLLNLSSVQKLKVQSLISLFGKRVVNDYIVEFNVNIDLIFELIAEQQEITIGLGGN